MVAGKWPTGAGVCGWDASPPYVLLEQESEMTRMLGSTRSLQSSSLKKSISSLARFLLPKVPQSPKTAPAAGVQLFKHMSLEGLVQVQIMPSKGTWGYQCGYLMVSL